MVEIEKKNMEPERRTKFLRVMNLLRGERESAGEEGAGCIQEVKEDKNSQQRRCYSDVSGICLTSHSAQCI